MGVLEEITKMKGQGLTDEDIVTSLRERGVPPKEIKDALSQVRIKNAVSEYSSGEEGDLFKNQSGGEYSQKTKDISGQGEYLPQPGQDYGYPPQEEYAQQEYAAPQEEYGTYSPQTGVDANTIIEISEQVVSEKIKVIREEMNSLNEFKSLNQIRLENLNERLKRIEVVFDKLQITILEKIGSYGQNLETIKKEMEMVQDSFSKIVEPMVERAEKKQEEKVHQATKRKKKSKAK